MEKGNKKMSDVAMFEIERLEKRVCELEEKMKLLETEGHYFNIYSKLVTDERTTIKNKIKEKQKVNFRDGFLDRPERLRYYHILHELFFHAL